MVKEGDALRGWRIAIAASANRLRPGSGGASQSCARQAELESAARPRSQDLRGKTSFPDRRSIRRGALQQDARADRHPEGADRWPKPTARASVAHDQTLIRAPFSGIVLTKSANARHRHAVSSAPHDRRGGDDTTWNTEVEADVSNLDRQDLGGAAGRDPLTLSGAAAAGRGQRVVPTAIAARTLLVKVKFVERDARAADMSAKFPFPAPLHRGAQQVPALRPMPSPRATAQTWCRCRRRQHGNRPR
jgi:hypothetical protein